MLNWKIGNNWWFKNWKIASLIGESPINKPFSIANYNKLPESIGWWFHISSVQPQFEKVIFNAFHSFAEMTHAKDNSFQHVLHIFASQIYQCHMTPSRVAWATNPGCPIEKSQHQSPTKNDWHHDYNILLIILSYYNDVFSSLVSHDTSDISISSHQKPLHSLLLIQYRPSTSTRRASYNSDELRPIKSWRRGPLMRWCVDALLNSVAKLCCHFVVKFLYQALLELLSYQSSSVCSTVKIAFWWTLQNSAKIRDILIADQCHQRMGFLEAMSLDHSTGVWFRSAQDPSLCHLEELGGFFRLKTGYGSIPINTIFRGMNLHLPAILMFTRGTRFWHTANCCRMVDLSEKKTPEK